MTGLRVHNVGPGVTVQDLGRGASMAHGLSRGGAMDRLALYEASALLAQSPELAALEMAGFGGTFEALDDLRIALTGAPMVAEVDGARVAWNACHRLPKGARLTLGAVQAGVYGYLSVGGGFLTPERLGARATHLTAGLGAAVTAGEVLPLGKDPAPERVGLGLPAEARFDGGRIRVMPGPQTGLFDAALQERFCQTPFTRDHRGNRMGVRVMAKASGLGTDAGLSILSEVVVPGDIQITGDGTPFVLMAECQTTGGYPRIGTVLATDLPKVAQAPAGADLRFEMLPADAARALDQATARDWRALSGRVFPLIRDPATLANLLSYQLISGVTAGRDLDEAHGSL